MISAKRDILESRYKKHDDKAQPNALTPAGVVASKDFARGSSPKGNSKYTDLVEFRFTKASCSR